MPTDAPPYDGQMTEADRLRTLEAVQEDVVEPIHEPASLPGLHDRMRTAVVEPDRTALLNRAWPLVERFVEAELDYVTSGNRGIGRLSTSPRRLAAVSKSAFADPQVRGVFGLLSEETIVRGWGAFAAIGHIQADGPPEVRERSLEDLWNEWIPGIYAATRGAGPNQSAVLESCLAPVAERWHAHAEELGLIKGLRKGKARDEITVIAFFHLDAGVALMANSSSQTDARY